MCPKVKVGCFCPKAIRARKEKYLSSFKISTSFLSAEDSPAVLELLFAGSFSQAVEEAGAAALLALISFVQADSATVEELEEVLEELFFPRKPPWG